MRIILASFVLAASTLSAMAGPCPSRPDNASTHYNENQLATSLCQQQALDSAVELRQLQSNFDADLRNLQLQFEVQRQLLDAQRAAASALN